MSSPDSHLPDFLFSLPEKWNLELQTQDSSSAVPVEAEFTGLTLPDADVYPWNSFVSAQDDVESLRAEVERLRSDNRSLLAENLRYSESLPQMAKNLVLIKEELRSNIAAKEDVERQSDRIIDELRSRTSELTSRITELYSLAKANSIRRRAQRSSIIYLALSTALLLLTIAFGPLSITALISRGIVMVSIAFLVMAWCLPKMPELRQENEDD